jgi:hypothetical protein
MSIRKSNFYVNISIYVIFVVGIYLYESNIVNALAWSTIIFPLAWLGAHGQEKSIREILKDKERRPEEYKSSVVRLVFTVVTGFIIFICLVAFLVWLS